MQTTGQTAQPSSASCRVLLLDDNVSLACMMKRHFEIEGFHVTMAHLGYEALRLLGEQRFHLAIVDIDLPDITGFDVMIMADERGLLDNLKIVFCSGDPSAQRVEMATRFKDSVFLGKPFPLACLSTVEKAVKVNWRCDRTGSP
jgi:CheY-like chemotaxis protein